MTVGAALGMLGAAVGITALLMVGITMSVAKVSPVGIIRRLRSSTDEYTVRVRATGGVWNPAPDALSRRLLGSATATYRLEQTPEGEVVHLTYTPTGGSTQHLHGPVSDRIRRITNRRGRSRWRYSPLLVGLGQMVLGALGVAVALIITAGRSNDARVAGVFIGFFSGAFLPMFAIMFLGFGYAVWKTVRGNSG